MSDLKDFSPQAIKEREEDEKRHLQNDKVRDIEKELLRFVKSINNSRGGRFDVTDDNILFDQMNWVTKKLTGLGWNVTRRSECCCHNETFFSVFQTNHCPESVHGNTAE